MPIARNSWMLISCLWAFHMYLVSHCRNLDAKPDRLKLSASLQFMMQQKSGILLIAIIASTMRLVCNNFPMFPRTSLGKC